jgi:DNA polymerase-3 subunit beta
MLFTIEKKDFQKVLTTAYKAVPAKAALPMMENFLLEMKEDALHVTATDSAITIIANTEAKGEGSICVSAKLLLDAISLLPDGEIELSTEEGVCTINYGKGKFNLPCFPTDDYPTINTDIPGDPTVMVNCNLKEALSYVLPSVAKDQLRPALCGVNFNPVDGGYDLVATDSHSLSLQTVACDVKTGAFIIPTNTAKFLQSCLPDDEDTTLIYANDYSVSFMFGHTVINAVKVVGNFPKYQAVIPQNNESVLTATCEDLLAVVKRVSTCANKASNAIKFTLSTLGGATIEGQDIGFGCSAKETMDTVFYNGQDMTIGFKADLLSSLLSALSEENVSIAFDSPKKAVLITTENETRKAIVMPVAIQ